MLDVKCELLIKAICSQCSHLIGRYLPYNNNIKIQILIKFPIPHQVIEKDSVSTFPEILLLLFHCNRLSFPCRTFCMLQPLASCVPNVPDLSDKRKSRHLQISKVLAS